MKQKTLPINLSQEEIKQFCQRHSICKLSLFGSVLRDDFTRESDVDVLVEFAPGKTPGLAIISMQDELSTIINRQIDLRTSADLSCYFRDQVLAEAMVIYEQN
ncbi:nucleotidyltransferase family protein [Anabaena minutissima FACHB-250]|nr:nucleotidyltransferase family protein [Anabaena minutissima FACHB-250]